MITYAFTAETISPIFTVDKSDLKLGYPAKGLTDMVAIPLELHVPHMQMRSEGIDVLQARIKTAIEKMVEELNNPESS